MIEKNLSNIPVQRKGQKGFPGGTSGKEPICQCRRHKRHGFNPWVRKIHWRKVQQPTPLFWSGEFHGQRGLVGYSPWGCKESDMTKVRHAHGFYRFMFAIA